MRQTPRSRDLGRASLCAFVRCAFVRCAFVPVLLVLVAGGLAVSATAAKPSPEQLQARYDSARDRVVLRPRDQDAWAEIARVERFDGKPAGALQLPPLSSLPESGALARAAGPESAALSRKLAALGRSFDGWAGFWVHDLRTGATARWNSDARFPAASTVKLGVIAAALRRYGPRPERSSAWYDLRQLAGWSSNLAANRLASKLGGPDVVGDQLERLGMWSSTYPGRLPRRELDRRRAQAAAADALARDDRSRPRPRALAAAGGGVRQPLRTEPHRSHAARVRAGAPAAPLRRSPRRERRPDPSVPSAGRRSRRRTAGSPTPATPPRSSTSGTGPGSPSSSRTSPS